MGRLVFTLVSTVFLSTFANAKPILIRYQNYAKSRAYLKEFNQQSCNFNSIKKTNDF